ncbi:hypothetical protein AMS68_003884 [Peltaster fructicola]|uniref:SURP motif domain-containing protein n=1 Tax=Peltaster fructicola TaxID=286661 RepID=A0A6H0XUC3_9PEZI|nr:hypothetical protein AMS68_003884 [Peltaster fructicola]
MANTTDDAKEAILADIAARAPSNLTVPPRGIRSTIETTAGYVARSGPLYEDKVRQNSASIGTRMTFLDAGDPYEPYYRWRLSELKAGVGNALAAGRINEVSFAGREPSKGPEKPEDFTFSARMPQISSQDLEVIKLTALFVAKNGRHWMTQLSQREAANPQFHFLRPQHTYYQYYSRLLDQYSNLINGAAADGRPQKKRIIQLEDNVKNRPNVLERAKKRAEWVKHQEAQKIAKEEKAEKEAVAFAQIDWADFIIVETVVFDERDENAYLPPPPRLNDLQSASLEQKAAMSIDPGRRIEEAFPTFDNYGQPYGQQPPPQHPQSQYPPQNHYPTPPPVQGYPPPQVQGMPPPFQPNSRMANIEADRERVRAAQEAARNAPAMKIRENYVPRAQAKTAATAMSLCPNCKQSIPTAEMAEHIRIELLDPRWREQSKIAQQRASTTNLSTADVANNLKRLASQRTDLFDPITGRALPDAESAAKRVPPPQGVNGAPGGIQNGQNTTDLNAQIQNLHQRYGQQPP